MTHRAIWLLAPLLAGCASTLPAPPPGQAAAGCHPGQAQVLILGTFHFAQQEAVDVLAPERQAELAGVLDELARFAPDAIAVEWPRAQNDELQTSYQRYLQAGEGSLTSANEIGQIGFRLARRMGHARVHAVDVPMKLWHDSIQVFDDTYPEARDRLRRQWSQQWPAAPRPRAGASIGALLREWNAATPPGMPEYGRFMPLVEGEVYAGALKLRPWYDRNLRIVQNLFRVAESPGDRVLLLIGGSHVPVLRHLVEVTPQLCSVDPLPYLR